MKCLTQKMMQSNAVYLTGIMMIQGRDSLTDEEVEPGQLVLELADAGGERHNLF